MALFLLPPSEKQRCICNNGGPDIKMVKMMQTSDAIPTTSYKVSKTVEIRPPKKEQHTLMDKKVTIQ